MTSSSVPRKSSSPPGSYIDAFPFVIFPLHMHALAVHALGMLRLRRTVYAPIEKVSGRFIGDHTTVESRSSRGEVKGSRYHGTVAGEVQFKNKVSVNSATFE
jgi:hypothetical protein